jgi:hypothetical protein
MTDEEHKKLIETVGAIFARSALRQAHERIGKWPNGSTEFMTVRQLDAWMSADMNSYYLLAPK